MRTYALLFFTAFFVASMLTKAVAEDASTKEQVDFLVEQLASKNPMPREIRGSAAEYPVNYNRKLQTAVHDAYRKLNALGVTAFPYLIDHFDDQRYALTADAGAMDKNLSVGELCYYIVELQIQPDKGWTVGAGDPRFRKFRPHYPKHINLRDKTAALKWWECNKRRSLAEIQIAVTEWMIAEETKSSEEYTDDERRALMKRLQDLRNTGKPIPSAIPWLK